MNFRSLYAPFTLFRQVTPPIPAGHSKAPLRHLAKRGFAHNLEVFSLSATGSDAPVRRGKFPCQGVSVLPELYVHRVVRFVSGGRPPDCPAAVPQVSRPYPADIQPVSGHRPAGIPSGSVKYPAGIRRNSPPVSGFRIAPGQVLRNGSSRRPRRRSMVFFTALKIFSYPVQRHRWPDSSLRSWSSV